MSASNKGITEKLCGKWMPRKKTTCARTPGHGGPCSTPEAMDRALKGNTALGYIERMYGLARAYLDSPPGKLAVMAAA
jgi:hypothetical protein